MLQIKVILDPATAIRYDKWDSLRAFLLGLIPLVKERFGIENGAHVRLTIIKALETVDEENVQIIICYTVGKGEDQDLSFDPHPTAKKRLGEMIRQRLNDYQERHLSSHPLTLSVGFRPIPDGFFIMFK